MCLRYIVSCCDEKDWRCKGTQELNDEKAGDVLEAIWGLLWYRHNQGILANVVPERILPTASLEIYCAKMTRVVLMFDALWPRCLGASEWQTSERFAEALI